MIRLVGAAAAAIAFALSIATPATAQHAGHTMPAAKPAPARPSAPDPHAGHAAPTSEPVAEATETPGQAATGTDLEPGSASAPTPPTDHHADLFWSPAAMARSRNQMHAEHGGQSFSMIMLNRAEVQPEGDGGILRWDGEAWFGGDIDRLTIKSEGEGRLGRPLDAVELQALYSHAVDAYWNLQAGVRHDFRPDPERSYATIGIEGLAPYWFEVEAALFLSDKGDLLGRIEGYYDQRITNRLILQPRAELNFAAQDVAENGIGAGLSDAELGLRLRYEIRREFAPYVGLSWERKIGDTARYARRQGDGRTSAGAVFGLRFWF
ncbi:MAG: Copper resistance protein CopB [Sphingomonas bacterium]|nr:Copper resistance protein CopB [Sphingomonas bacterium]